MSAMYLHNNNTPTSETQELFQPTWLYIKQHNQTGLKYFGKTTGNPLKYKGSGVHWIRHIKKHGNDVTTIWCQLFTEKELLVEYALTFSNENNIVESKEWANLIPESGLDGGAVKGRKLPPRSEIHKSRLSEAKKGKPASTEALELLAKYRKLRVYSPLSDKTKKKLRESKLGKKSTEATKALLSMRRKGAGNPNFGKHWYNNGIQTVSSFTCPDGFVKGKLKK